MWAINKEPDLSIPNLVNAVGLSFPIARLTPLDKLTITEVNPHQFSIPTPITNESVVFPDFNQLAVLVLDRAARQVGLSNGFDNLGFRHANLKPNKLARRGTASNQHECHYYGVFHNGPPMQPLIVDTGLAVLPTSKYGGLVWLPLRA